MVYNAQGLVYSPRLNKGKKAEHSAHRIRKTDQKDYISEYTNYPKSILEFKSEFNSMHPTQKPVALLEYLIKTYTNEGDVVLDNTMGSGTTGVACVNTNRNFIGMELDDKYFEIAKARINEAITAKQLKLS
jgi:site-specific DNA-methyltransferase (adenine-specific)